MERQGSTLRCGVNHTSLTVCSVTERLKELHRAIASPVDEYTIRTTYPDLKFWTFRIRVSGHAFPPLFTRTTHPMRTFDFASTLGSYGYLVWNCETLSFFEQSPPVCFCPLYHVHLILLVTNGPNQCPMHKFGLNVDK